MIRDIARKYNQTLIIVSHDPEIADYANRIITIIDGNIHKIEVKNGEEREIIYERKE